MSYRRHSCNILCINPKQKEHEYTMFSVYAVSNYAVLHLCGTRKWSKFLLYAAIFSHYAVFGQNHSI